MAIIKRSFLSNLIGKNSYDDFKGFAKIIVAIGTCLIAFFFCLTLFFHSKFVGSLFSLVSGVSLIFLIYISALVLLLDIEVDVDEYDMRSNTTKPFKYKLTIVWGVILIIIGISAIHFTNKYRKHYQFECETFLVDEVNGIFHLNYKNGCEYAAESDGLVKMRGFQIDESYTFCEWCEEWAEDAEADYESSRYFRK